MEIVVLKMLFIVGVSGQYGKYVYVEQATTWPLARDHCRNQYTDLACITTPRTEKRLKNATVGKVNGEFWIGLHMDTTHWKWSGGGLATNIPWASGQPDDTDQQKAACLCWHNCQWNGWHNTHSSETRPFLCFNLIVNNSKMTWEMAMRECKRQHTDLTSLISESEQLLALSEINHMTEPVWIGLRYLGGSWMWVNGERVVYEAWPQGGDQDHLCPIQKRCGALTKDGLWENRDCQDTLNFICY